MTPAAVTDLLAAFAVRYGKRWREASEGISPDAQILAWHEDLEGIPDDIGQEAAARVRRSLPHPPTPADICQAAEGLGWGKTHQYWHRVNTIYSRRDLPWQTRSRRIRAMMGVLGPVVHLGYPDDPPFPQDIQGWAETEGKLWENAEERAARYREGAATAYLMERRAADETQGDDPVRQPHPQPQPTPTPAPQPATGRAA